MADDRGTSSRDSPKAKILLRSVLTVTAEVTSLALLFGFLISCAYNSYLFSTWGLNFLAIATPNDVIMSGVMTALPVFMSVAPFVFGLYMLKPLYRVARSSEDDISNDPYGVAAMIFVVALTTLATFFGGSVGLFAQSIWSPLSVGILIAGLYKITKNWRPKFAKNEWINFGAKYGSVSLILTGILSLLYNVLATTSAEYDLRRIDFGFLSASSSTGQKGDENRYFAINLGIERCPRAMVLWTGEESTVINCAPAGPFFGKENILVVRAPQGTIFGTKYMHPDGPRKPSRYVDCSWPASDADRKSCAESKLRYIEVWGLPPATEPAPDRKPSAALSPAAPVTSKRR